MLSREPGTDFAVIGTEEVAFDFANLYLGSLGYEDLARVHEGASPVDNLGLKVGRRASR